MSITAYTGLPGAGKSYGVVQHVILPSLEAGRVVVTNIPLNLEAIKKRIPTFKLVQLEKKCPAQDWLDSPSGAVIVIDEAWNWWPAGVTADQIPVPQKTFYAEHRHKVGTDGKSTEIVLVTQDLSQICAFVRALVEETFRCVKLTSVGSTNRFRVDCYTGAVTGQTPPKASLMRQMFGKYQADIYACYQSHTQSKTGLAGMEEKADKRGTIFGSWTMKASAAAILLLPVAIYFAVHALTGFRQQVTKVPEAKRSAAPAPVTAPQPMPRPILPPPSAIPVAADTPALLPPPDNSPKGPKLSGSWRIIGTIVRKDRTGIALLKSPTAQRRVNLTTCEHSGSDLDLKCELDGELVTYYSGDTGSFASAAVASGVVGGN